MQVSDLILGLLIILVVGWIVMMAVEQRSIAVSLNTLSIKQAAQAVLVSPNKCQPMAGQRLVKAVELLEKEYVTTVGFDGDLNQNYFCFYEST